MLPAAIGTMTFVVSKAQHRWFLSEQAMAPDNTSVDVTQCLVRIGRGEQRAADELLPLVYDELRALAGARFRHERPDHTLQPTALINEVYLRLVDQTQVQWKDRNHFFAVAAEAIRRLLVDHARSKRAEKRQTPGPRVSVHPDHDAPQPDSIDLVELEDVLNRLASLSPRQAKVVELRYFGGLSVEETAAVLGVSEGTVKGDWRLARAWLERELAPGDSM